jgi:predicted nucleic acid-binding protein
MTTGKAFVDTNVFIYAHDSREGKKRNVALRLLERLIADGNGVVSTQVCMEYASVAASKLGQPLDSIHCQLAALDSFEVVATTVPLIQTALIAMRTYGLSFWDSVIITAAESARCDVVYTEDLNDGQRYGTVRAVNPFA